ncbi:hypothetical protein BgiBS90_009965 [Biomphalaria glabrata]|nr:hypothetical protein BgiBS90_009965 [Biomphalaria glabrata]
MVEKRGSIQQGSESGFTTGVQSTVDYSTVQRCGSVQSLTTVQCGVLSSTVETNGVLILVCDRVRHNEPKCVKSVPNC